MKTLHKIWIAAALLLALGFGALTGLSNNTPLAAVTGPALVAHADDDSCDTVPPPGGLDCPEFTPTPTPTPQPG